MRGAARPEGEGALSPYRALDLTEGGYNLSARILGDLGADVLRLEPPGGAPTRDIGPFLHGQRHRERSLFFFAYNFNKRSVTLDLGHQRGRELFLALVRSADFLFESFPPGYMDSLGLGYQALARVNPRLIYVAITPFGQTGPYARYRATDLVIWAMGGYLWMTGDPDRPPVRISLPPQAEFHAAASAAGAALIALFHRHRTGRGTLVDQSAQQCPPWMLTHTYQFYEYQGVVLKREGQWRHFAGVRARTVFPCRDGYLVAMMPGGVLGARANKRLVEWMDQEGMCPPWMRAIDWDTFDAASTPQEQVEAIGEAFARFFLTRTREELLQEALRRGLLLAPVYTLADLVNSPHLRARRFFVEVEHPDLGVTLLYPGGPFLMHGTPWRFYRPPPRIGQHTREVLCGELGLTPSEVDALRAQGVV